MPLPKYFEMHKPFLEYLGDGKEHKLKELKVYVCQQFGLTEEELAELLPSGRQTVFINRQRKSTEENEETPDDIFEDAFKKINRGLQDELLNEVMKLSPQAFEQMVLDLMSKMGYGTFENAARTTKQSNDEGIDGIIMEDKLGFDRIYIQARKWNEEHTVGRLEVQAFAGAIAGRGGKGLFVTTSKFSKQAVGKVFPLLISLN